MNWLDSIAGENLNAAGKMWHDLRSGRAGGPLRMGLSVASAAAMLAVMLGFMGLIEASGRRVGDAEIGFAIGLALVSWCASLIVIWSRYRKFGRVIRTALVIIAVWSMLIPIAFAIASATRDAEFLIAALIFIGVALTILLGCIAAYQALGGKAIADPRGLIQVNCPTCDYSMIGLDSCTCPECGGRCTIDQLIEAQDYESLRRRNLIASRPRTTSVVEQPLAISAHRVDEGGGATAHSAMPAG